MSAARRLRPLRHEVGEHVMTEILYHGDCVDLAQSMSNFIKVGKRSGWHDPSQFRHWSRNGQWRQPPILFPPIARRSINRNVFLDVKQQSGLDPTHTMPKILHGQNFCHSHNFVIYGVYQNGANFSIQIFMKKELWCGRPSAAAHYQYQLHKSWPVSAPLTTGDPLAPGQLRWTPPA